MADFMPAYDKAKPSILKFLLYLENGQFFL